MQTLLLRHSCRPTAFDRSATPPHPLASFVPAFYPNETTGAGAVAHLVEPIAPTAQKAWADNRQRRIRNRAAHLQGDHAQSTSAPAQNDLQREAQKPR